MRSGITWSAAHEESLTEEATHAHSLAPFMAAGSLQPSMAHYFPGYRPFDPESLGLDAGFRLTSFSDMKG